MSVRRVVVSSGARCLRESLRIKRIPVPLAGLDRAVRVPLRTLQRYGGTLDTARVYLA